MATKIKVAQGECTSSIAFTHGFVPDTIWNDSDNAGLRGRRAERNVLLPGDELHVRDARVEEDPRVDARRHRYRRKGAAEKLALRLEEYGEPRKGVRYQLTVDGRIHEGRTDDEGRLEHRVSPDARAASLIVGQTEAYRIRLGAVDPVDSPSGIAQRLVNLGRLAAVDAPPSALEAAIRQFQREHDLAPTGAVDDATRDQMVDAHGY